MKGMFHSKFGNAATLFLALLYCVSNLRATVLESLISNQDFSTTSAGMAHAGVGKANDISYLSVNPAAVNNTVFMNLFLNQNLGFAGNYLTYFALGFHTFDQNFAVSGAVWLPQQIEELNDYGQSIGTVRVFDSFFGLTWGNTATKKFTWGQPGTMTEILGNVLSGTYEFGTTAKMVHSQLIDYSIVVPAFDVGGVFRKKIDALVFLPSRTPHNLSFGAGLLNMGPEATYHQTSETQPFRWTTGMEYIFLAMKDHEMATMFSIEKRLERDMTYHLGLEYTAYSFAKARVGYILGDVTRGIAAGMSVYYNYFSVYNAELSYGLGMVRDLGMEHQFGFRVNYNRDVLSKRVDRVQKESNKVHQDIDQEVTDIVQKCVNNHFKLKEKYPVVLSEAPLKVCYGEYGFSDVPQPVTGVLAYNPKTGVVSLQKIEKGDSKSDQVDEVFLVDGSIVRGMIADVTNKQFVLNNDIGKVQIERELVSYVRFNFVTEEDRALLAQINDVVKDFRAAQQRFPKDVAEISTQFLKQYGMALPDPTTGRYMYSQDKGTIMIVDNYPPMYQKKEAKPIPGKLANPDNKSVPTKPENKAAAPEKELLLK